MTRTLTCTATLAVLALGPALAGCGSSDDPASASAATGSPVPDSTEAPSPTPKAGPGHRPDSDGDGIPDPVTVKARIGRGVILAGSGLNDDPSDHRQTRIRVTVKAVRGPFGGFQVPAGRKLIGVDVTYENLGRLRYDDAQPHGQLTVSGGESGKQTSLIPIGGKNPCDNPSLKLRRGESERGCIAFEVPKTARPRTFEYVSDDGYGDTGLWRLP